MKRAVFICIALSLSTSALSDGILCYEDARPVDGDYKEVRLDSTDQGYDLTAKIITAGFGAPVKTTEKTLATDLVCNLDGLIAYCFKSASVSGVQTHSIVEFSMVTRTQLTSLLQTAAEEAPEEIEIQVGSPLPPHLSKRFKFDVGV